MVADRLVSLQPCLQQLHGVRHRQLVGAGVVGDRRRRLVALHEGAVAADAHDHLFPGLVAAQRDRAHLARVDLLRLVVEEGTQPRLAVAEVEVAQVGRAILLAAGDRVEAILHPHRERGVDQVGEVLFHQRHHRESGEGGDERGALLEGVLAPLDGADDRGVGARSADSRLLERLDQRRFREALRRHGGVLLAVDRVDADLFSLDQRGQDRLLVRQRRRGIVRALDVRAQETREVDDVAGGLEHRLPVASFVDDEHAHPTPRGVLHLARHGALPDQLVDLRLVGAELLLDGADRRDHVAGGTDRLVRFLGVLDLLEVLARLVGQVLLAVGLGDVRARQFDRGGGEHHRIGPHVGDEPVLVEALRGAHRARGFEAQLAVPLLLQRGGGERRRGRAGERLLGGGADAQLIRAHHVAERLRVGLVEELDPLLLQLAGVGIEVLAPRDLPSVEGLQPCVERLARARAQLGDEIPVLRGAEAHPRAFPLDEHLDRHALHPPRRQPRADLAPQHGGDLVAVEAVDHPARFLRLHEVRVDLAGRLQRGEHRGLGDLVEHHP